MTGLSRCSWRRRASMVDLGVFGFPRSSASGSPAAATSRKTTKLETTMSGIEMASRRRMNPPMGLGLQAPLLHVPERRLRRGVVDDVDVLVGEGDECRLLVQREVDQVGPHR